MYTFLEKKYYIPIYNIRFNVDFQEVVGLNLFESLILAIPEKYNLHEKKLSKKHLMGNAIRFENLAQLVNLLRLEPNLFRISLENLINNGAIEPIEIGVNQDWLEKIKLSDIKITKDGIKFLKNKKEFLIIWVKNFFRYPLQYIKAFLNLTYPAWYPGTSVFDGEIYYFEKKKIDANGRIESF